MQISGHAGLEFAVRRRLAIAYLVRADLLAPVFASAFRFELIVRSLRLRALSVKRADRRRDQGRVATRRDCSRPFRRQRLDTLDLSLYGSAIKYSSGKVEGLATEFKNFEKVVATHFAVIPRERDNFDFVSNDIIAGPGGEISKKELDPSGIGRKVWIEFTGTVATKTYTISDFTADRDYYNTWSLLPQINLLSAIRGVEDNLWASGVTKFLEGDKPIIYGTTGDDTLSSILLQNHYYLGSYVQNGVVIIGGSGIDVLRGSPADDRLEGGEGNDAFGFQGNDTLKGGNGTDTADYLERHGGIGPPGFA